MTGFADILAFRTLEVIEITDKVSAMENTRRIFRGL